MPAKSPDIVVIGAGAFGGWTALHLLNRGARVTLVDAWGAGHLRGTSSGETRVIRCGYGLKPVYTAWAWRALKLWKRWQRKWATEFFVNSGVLWLCAEEDAYVRASFAALRRLRIPHERLSTAELARRYPQMNFEGIRFGYLEPRAGFLRARAATMRVAEAVAQHPRGRALIAAAEPPDSKLENRSRSLGTRLGKIRTHNGATLRADAFVFACGPWLPQLFPALLGRRIRVTQQDVHFFGPPPGDRRFESGAMPVWIEPASDYYCVPAFDSRGVKIACDAPGPIFDPTTGERIADSAGAEAARRHLARRLPAMRAAPLVETRVCQYERTPDSHLVMDRHPEYENVWLVGGGSGHGFKLGPAVGEFVAEQLLARRPKPLPPEMRLGASAWPDSGPLPITHSF